MDFPIQVKELPAQLALTARQTIAVATIGEGVGAGFGAIMAGAGDAAPFTGPPFVLYDEVKGDTVDIAVCMPVAPGATAGPGVTLEEVPGGRFATLVHKGAYSTLHNAYDTLRAWMAANKQTPSWPMRETYLNDPDRAPEDELLTEIAWPLA